MHSFRFKQVLAGLFIMGGLSLPAMGKGATTTDSEPQVRVEHTANSRTVHLVYQSTTLQPVIIRVVDKDGHSLYQTKLTKEVNFKKAISFSNVPDGPYYIEVTGEGVNFREMVNVTTVTDASESLVATVYPYAQEGKWMLSVPNAERVSVEILNQNGEEIYYGDVTLEGDSHSKVFDLSRLRDSQVSFRITDGALTSLQTVNLR